MFFVVLISCQKESGCWKDNSESIFQTIPINTITEFKLFSNVIGSFEYSSETYLSIETTSFLLEHLSIDTSISNVCSIESFVPCKLLRKNKEDVIKVTYHGPTAPSFFLRDLASLIVTDTIKDNLKIRTVNALGSIALNVNNDSTYWDLQSSALDIQINGKAHYTYLYNLGKSHFDGKNMINQFFHVNHQSTGDVYINASEQVIVELRDLGDVYLVQEPNVRLVTDQSGKGKIKQL